MKVKKIASIAFFASLFSFIIIWGYLPKLWLMGWPQWVLLAVTVTSLGAWAIFSLESLAQWIKKRATHYWIDMLLKVATAVIILAVINWFAVDKNWKKDFTSNQIHSLSEQSAKILHELKEPVTITVWSSSIDEMMTNISAKKFFENYKLKGEGKVTVQIKNPNEDPIGSEKDRVQKKRHLVIVRAAGGSEARIENFSDAKAEELVTNAIIQATKRGRKKTICFIAGHGELALDSGEPGGLSLLKERLTSASYDVKEVTLANSESVPSDCDALALVGPQGNPSEKEPKLVQDFLEKGGQMVAFLGAGSSPVWKGFLKKYGVEVRNDIVVDPNVQPPIGVLTKNFAQDIDITKGVTGMALMLQSSSINVPSQSPDPGTMVRTFASSEAYTYAKEGDLKSLKNLAKSGADHKGPLPLGVVVEKKISASTPEPVKEAPAKDKKTSYLPALLFPEARAEDHAHPTVAPKSGLDLGTPDVPVTAEAGKASDREMSVVVFGNHYFVANSFIGQFLNMDLVLNSFNYVLKDRGEMGIRPREIRQATLQLTNESINQVMATLALLGLLFVVGALWAKSRRSSLA